MADKMEFTDLKTGEVMESTPLARTAVGVFVLVCWTIAVFLFCRAIGNTIDDKLIFMEGIALGVGGGVIIASLLTAFRGDSVPTMGGEPFFYWPHDAIARWQHRRRKAKSDAVSHQ